MKNRVDYWAGEETVSERVVEKVVKLCVGSIEKRSIVDEPHAAREGKANDDDLHNVARWHHDRAWVHDSTGRCWEGMQVFLMRCA